MYEPNNALKEFDLIANKYRNISDEFRNETFAKMRSILKTESESHKSDADYEKYSDIGYILGSSTQTESFLWYFIFQQRPLMRYVSLLHIMQYRRCWWVSINYVEQYSPANCKPNTYSSHLRSPIRIYLLRRLIKQSKLDIICGKRRFHWNKLKLI